MPHFAQTHRWLTGAVWRPLLATALLVAIAGTSCNPNPLEPAPGDDFLSPAGLSDDQSDAIQDAVQNEQVLGDQPEPPPPPAPDGGPAHAPPTADAGPDLVAEGGQLVLLNGSGRSTTGGPLSYLWEQVSGPAVVLANAKTPRARFITPLMDTEILLAFTLTVTDESILDPDSGRPGNAKGSDNVNVRVKGRNKPPVARFRADPTSGQAPLTVRFDASESTDPEGSALSYAWSFGDGATGSAVTTSHQYMTPGRYAVALVVTDEAGAEGSATGTVFVAEPPPPNSAPTVDAGADQAIVVTGLCDLQGTVSDDGLPNPPGAVATTWSVVSGPGSVVFDDASALAATASFTAPGTYELQLTADDGELVTSDTVTVYVVPVITIDMSPASGTAPLEVQYTAKLGDQPITDADLPAGSTSHLLWDFGDGYMDYGAQTSHVYSLGGTYQVTLTLVLASLGLSDISCVRLTDNDCDRSVQTFAPLTATPTISPNGGTYRGSVQVGLGCETPGATIHYTLDGSDPSSNSAVYSGALTLTDSAMLRARAFATGYGPSDIASGEFTIEPPPDGEEDVSFVGLPAGSDPPDWFDTGANNSMVQDHSLFKVFSVGGTSVFGTTSTLTNIHSHYIPTGSATWTAYRLAGRFMVDDSGAGIGITFLSDYPNSDTYYRLRRTGSGDSLHISPHPNGVMMTGGTTDTAVVPVPNTWYRYTVEVEAGAARTDIRAKVWAEGAVEPASWQVECFDDHADRITAGTIGVWSMGSGGKFWGDMQLVFGGGLLAAHAGPDATISAGGSTILSGSASGGTPPYTYTWSPPTGLSSTNVAQPTASPIVTTVYTLTVRDAHNTPATDTVTVTVLPPVISGRVTAANGTAISGVTISGLPGNPVTNASGDYSVTVTSPFTGTAAPTKTGYTFLPPSRIYANLVVNLANQNYIGILQTFTISGRVTDGGGTGISGVAMNGLPGSPVTNATGDYTATVNHGTSVTVTPTKAGYTFSPASRTYPSVTASQASQNYTGTPPPQTFTISGRVTTSGGAAVSGVTIGGLPATPITDGSGNYTATVNSGFSGTATPSRAGYTFSPASRSYSSVSANQVGQDYTATPIVPQTFTISGRVTDSGGAGVAGVTLTGLTGSPVTDTNGNYSATVASGFSGTATPTKSGYTFSPVSRSYSNVASNQASQSYTGTSGPPPTKILVPGPGWTGATPEPGPVGTPGSPGYDAKAIARWDVVPLQTFDGDFNVGVVAFHMNGIDRVEFAVNGGPWLAVREMTLNPQVNVVEYWATLRAADFADGPVEVRAIAYPTIGNARVLAGDVDPNSTNLCRGSGEYSLFLYANSAGTLAGPALYVKPSSGSDRNEGTETQPLATLKAALDLLRAMQVAGTLVDGATVILMEQGVYDAHRPGGWPDPTIVNERYITIKATEGLDRSEVVISPAASLPLLNNEFRPRVDRLHWQHLSIDVRDYGKYVNAGVRGMVTWFDDVRFFNTAGNKVDGGRIHEETPYWITDSLHEQIRLGITDAQLARNVTLRDMTWDVFNNNRVVINAAVSDFGNIDPSGATHCDLIQYYGNYDNVINYGLTLRNSWDAQMFFVNSPMQVGQYMRNSAFVGIDIEYSGLRLDGTSSSNSTQLNGRQDHVLYYDISNPRQGWYFRDDSTGGMKFVATNVVFRECILLRFPWFRAIPTGVSLVDCTILTAP